MAEAAGIVGEFFALKDGTEADLLAMQCGDFYEFFGEDAKIVERELDLKVSSKSSGGESYPMAGVPVDELTPYLQALIDRGYRVAVADQYETDDGYAREIARIVTPGTFLETSQTAAQYLVSIVCTGDGAVGVAFAEASTGRFYVDQYTGSDAMDQALSTCHRFDPVEALIGPELRERDDVTSVVTERIGARISDAAVELFAPGRADHAVREQFGEHARDSLQLDERPAAIRAAGAIVGYLEQTDADVLRAVTRMTPLADGTEVRLDARTQRNLELVSPLADGGATVLETIDHTVSSPGRRLLREWLHRPLRDRERLARRHDGVDALLAAPLARDALQEHLADVADVARLANRAARGSADPRAIRAIAETLTAVPEIHRLIEETPEFADSPLAGWRDYDQDAIADLSAKLTGALREDPPGTAGDGEIFQRGYDEELDELIEAHEAALEWLDDLAEREQARHDITHLQVDRNRTDGYYIQVGQSETDQVPSEYREIKTLKQSKRYTTEELDEKEREVLRLESARADLEYDRFCALREAVGDVATALQDLGRALGRLDVLVSLTVHAVEAGWTKPTLAPPDDGIEIEAGRHPVVETSTDFVPNDVTLDHENRFLLVTGPNMSGKSTYLRQTALIVLLAQIGSYVPASHARVGVVDGIYTRVGALDELAHGRSTFMVEMQELANILHSATADSLVILDEVGRGTATFDGMSIAWAATEFLHNRLEAQTLFATHYHQLTDLVDRLPGGRNVHVAVEERDGDVTFLRTIETGPADRSYGIHVAELAGVPDPVTDRADEVLAQLRADNPVEARSGETTESVQAVFDVQRGEYRRAATPDGGTGASVPDELEAVLRELAEIDVSAIRPVDLAGRVADWQDRIGTDLD